MLKRLIAIIIRGPVFVILVGGGCVVLCKNCFVRPGTVNSRG